MNVDAALHELSRLPAAPYDLAELALVLARDQYPDLDVQAYLLMISGMAHEARQYLTGTDLGKRVDRLRWYLFQEMGFRGNARNYYDPRNSYLNEVLERRKGIPISLSAVVIAVGKRAGLDIRGVGLPGHFIVKAVRDDEEVFFDPFHGGRVLTPADCEILVAQTTSVPFTATRETLRDAPLQLILLRMLNNLRSIYARRDDLDRLVQVLGRMCQLQPGDASLQRAYGIVLVRTGQPARAIDALEVALRGSLDDEAAHSAREWLSKAQSEISRWN